MQTPPNAHDREKVAARPEGDPGRAHHHRYGEPAAGGATTAEQKPLTRSVADPGRLVTAIEDALRTLRGHVITAGVALCLAELVQAEAPWCTMEDLGALVAPPIAMGCVLDDQTIGERARNIATHALYGC